MIPAFLLHLTIFLFTFKGSQTLKVLECVSRNRISAAVGAGENQAPWW